MIFTLKTPRKTAATWKMLKQLPKRVDVLRRVVPQIVAEAVQRDVVENIPTGREWKTYRQGLETVRISGNRKAPAFAVVLSARAATSTRTRKVDSTSTLIYIRSRRRLAKLSDVVRILERYNPWTPETLPFTPAAREARMISKKVTRQTASRVTRDRKRDRTFWSVELQRAGHKEVKKDKRLRTSAVAKPQPDAAYPALRLEFGLGQKAHPHWRPAIRPFTRQPGHAILREAPNLVDLFDPAFRGWKTWGGKVQRTISRAEAKRFTPFQNKLGL